MNEYVSKHSFSKGTPERAGLPPTDQLLNVKEKAKKFCNIYLKPPLATPPHRTRSDLLSSSFIRMCCWKIRFSYNYYSGNHLCFFFLLQISSYVLKHHNF